VQTQNAFSFFRRFPLVAALPRHAVSPTASRQTVRIPAPTAVSASHRLLSYFVLQTSDFFRPSAFRFRTSRYVVLSSPVLGLWSLVFFCFLLSQFLLFPRVREPIVNPVHPTQPSFHQPLTSLPHPENEPTRHYWRPQHKQPGPTRNKSQIPMDPTDKRNCVRITPRIRPGGPFENSPAFQRWVYGPPGPSPEGTAERVYGNLRDTPRRSAGFSLQRRPVAA